MRKALWVLLLLFIPFQVNANPVLPGEKEKNQVWLEIVKAKKSYRVMYFDTLWIKRLERKMAILRYLEDRNYIPTEKDLKRLSTKEREEYALLMKEYSISQRDSHNHFNRAIQLALKFYDIKPHHQSGKILSGSPKQIGKSLTWSPKFSSKLQPHELSEEYFQTQPAFIREEDRAVILRPTAFNSPGELALTLYHESQHVDEMLNPGIDLRNQPASEVRIRQKTLPFLKKIFQLNPREWKNEIYTLEACHVLSDKWEYSMRYGASPFDTLKIASDFPTDLSPAEKTEIRRRVEMDFHSLERILLSKEKGALKRLAGELQARSKSKFLKSLNSDSLQELAKDWKRVMEESLQTTRDRIGELEWAKSLLRLRDMPMEEIEAEDRKVKEGVLEERKKRVEEFRKREEITKREQEKRKLRQEEAWNYLKSVAGLACFSPDSLSEQIGHQIVVGATLPVYELRERLLFTELSSCQRFVLEKMLKSPGLVPMERLVSWSRQYRKENPTFMEGFFKGIGEFFQSLNELLTIERGPDSHEDTSSTKPRKEYSEEPYRKKGSQRRDGSGIEFKSRTYDYLKGIKGGIGGFD